MYCQNQMFNMQLNVLYNWCTIKFQLHLKFVYDMQGHMTHGYIAFNNLGIYMYNYYALMPNVKKYINDE